MEPVAHTNTHSTHMIKKCNARADVEGPSRFCPSPKSDQTVETLRVFFSSECSIIYSRRLFDLAERLSIKQHSQGFVFNRIYERHVLVVLRTHFEFANAFSQCCTITYQCQSSSDVFTLGCTKVPNAVHVTSFVFTLHDVTSYIRCEYSK